MTYRSIFSTAAAALLGFAVQVPNIQAQARICGNNNVVSGSFGFTSSRAGFFLAGATPPSTTSVTGTGPMVPVSATPPGTTGASTWSLTPVGTLVGDLASPNVFTTLGRIVADGNGNLYASSTPGGTANTLVGTYNVGLDCGIVMTLNDAFSASNTTAPVSTPNYTAMFEGEIMDSGSGFEQINLVQTNSGAAGAILTLQQTTQANGCTNTSLSGNFGLVGSGLYMANALNVSTTGSSLTGTGSTTSLCTRTPGVTTSPAPTSPPTACPTTGFVPGVATNLGTPFTLLGRFFADGNGNLTTDAAALASTTHLGITGSYTVNSDCTGTARLTDASGVSRDINFVLVEKASQAIVGPKQELDFVFSDSGVFGSGYADAQ
jgi:hypothetical protein